MLGAFISTHTTYLHSWSCIFVQDVVLPLRKKNAPLTQRNQLRLLRASALGVALFALVFSTFYAHSEAVLLYFAATGAIFVGWSGAVIIGGLYWRRGTTRGAWVAAISGITLVLAGLLLQQTGRDFRENGVAFYGLLDWLGHDRSLEIAERVHHALPNGQELWGWAMVVCSLVYILASFPWSKRFDLDRLLHRNERKRPATPSTRGPRHPSLLRLIGINDEFSIWDRRLYFATICFNAAWIAVFVIGSLYVAWHVYVEGLPIRDLDEAWFRFWRIKVWIMLAVSCVVTILFTLGGFRDASRMLRDLRSHEVTDDDTGIVREGDSKGGEDS